MVETATLAPLDLFDCLGVLGAALYVCNYTRLVMQRVSAERASYFLVNLLAASLVLVSLSQAFNLGAALIQLFFIVMSLIGMVDRLHPVRRLGRWRRARAPAPRPIRWHRPGLADKRA